MKTFNALQTSNAFFTMVESIIIS